MYLQWLKHLGFLGEGRREVLLDNMSPEMTRVAISSGDTDKERLFMTKIRIARQICDGSTTISVY